MKFFNIIILLISFFFVFSKALIDKNNVEKYNNALNLIKKKLSQIYNRYELNTPEGLSVFGVTSNFKTDLWDMNVYKLALRIVEKSPFTAVMSGTSVSAGHDNKYEDAFPFVFERVFKNIFEELDVEFILHNIAQGNNPCVPYSHCYQTMGGIIPDLFVWEQSFNCGHDSAVFERTIRFLATSKYPNTLYFASSGSVKPAPTCPKYVNNTFNHDPIKKTPRTVENWLPKDSGLPEWEVTKEKVKNLKEFFDKNAKSYPSSHRFNLSSFPKIKSTQIFGFDGWITNNKITTNTPPSDIIKACKPSFFSREALVFSSDSGGGALWHPSRGIHLFRGEILAFPYLLFLHDAINMILDDANLTNEERIKKYATFLLSYKETLPRPYKSSASYNATCYTDFTPQFSQGFSLKSRIVGETNWKYNNEKSKLFQKYGYQDTKPFFYPPSKNSEESISLYVSVKEINHFTLCTFDKISSSLKNLQLKLYQADPLKLKNLKTYTISEKDKEVPFTTSTYGDMCVNVNVEYPGEFIVNIYHPGSFKLTHLLTYHHERDYHI